MLYICAQQAASFPKPHLNKPTVFRKLRTQLFVVSSLLFFIAALNFNASAQTFTALVDQTTGGTATESNSLRSLALSGDDTKIFTGWLQNSGSGRKVIRYSTTAAAPAPRELEYSVTNFDGTQVGE